MRWTRTRHTCTEEDHTEVNAPLWRNANAPLLFSFLFVFFFGIRWGHFHGTCTRRDGRPSGGGGNEQAIVAAAAAEGRRGSMECHDKTMETHEGRGEGRRACKGSSDTRNGGGVKWREKCIPVDTNLKVSDKTFFLSVLVHYSNSRG